MALVASVSSSCNDGAGYATLRSISGGSGSYTYELRRDGVIVEQSTVQSTQLPIDFEGLYDGAYVLLVAEDGAPNNSGTASFRLSCGYPAPPEAPLLTLDFLRPTDPTATGAGSISAQASGGTAPLSVTLVELAMSQAATSGQAVLFDNIPAGRYTVRFTDAIGQEVSGTVTLRAYVPEPVRGCTDPRAKNYNPDATQDDNSCEYEAPVRVSYFDVPPMQSLRFVVPGSTIRAPFDNVLLADERPLDYENPGYCQKVTQDDTLVIQCLSNYQGILTLELRRQADDAVVLTVSGQRVQQGGGLTPSFEVYLKADNVNGRARAYFNEEALPLPFLAGQRVTISATGTSLDGTYPIEAVREDAAAAVPFLTLPVAYPAGTLRLDGSLSTTYAVQVYDTYQFVVLFAEVPRGCYYARINAQDTDFGEALALSEPIDVAQDWPGTALIQYRNFDNAFDLNYSHGLVHRIRAYARFFERQPATEKTVLRNDDGTLVLLSASAHRKVQLEVLLEPGWRHEQFAVAFCHDSVKVNAERVVLEGEYEHEPVQRFTLARGTALLELRNFLGAGNRDDYGDVDAGGPFLTVNGSRLKITR
jgi:hypothetical protein